MNRRPNPGIIRRNVLLGLLATGLVLLVAVAGHAQDQRPAETSAAGDFLGTLSAPERAWLREHPVITVALDPSWPPIEFTDEHGTPSGMTADYLRLMAARLGVKFERVPNLSWQDSYARLQRGEIDLATSVAVTAERETFWAFTKPYMTMPIVVVTRADVTYIADLRELAGRKVAVVEGNAPSIWMVRDFPDIQLVPVNTTQKALALLQRGEVFACVDNMLVVGSYLAGQKMTGLKVAGTTPYTNAQCMAVRKDWAILAGILDQALDSVSPTEREAIYRRWLPLLREPAFDYTRLWQIVAGFAALFLGLVAWNWKLTRESRERKRAEAALRRTDRALRMVNECNLELVRATSEPELLQSICRIAVDQGGYRMAWVGFAEQDDAKSVRPVARAGFEAGYLDTVNITWADDEHGRGPTGAAIRTGQPVVARDIPTDPAYGPWRAAAIQRGYTSSATLPLLSGERAFGALMVYAAESDAFNAEEVVLLGKLAADLAYGITALRALAERAQSERAMIASEARYRRLFETAKDGILILDAKTGAIVDVNPFLIEMLGYSHEAFLGKKVWELGFFMNLVANEANFVELQAKEYIRYEDMALETSDGRRIEVEFISNVYLVGGHKVIQCNIRDISERVRAEQQTQQSLAELEQARQVLLSVVEDEKAAAGELRKLSAVIEQAPLSVVITDLTGAIEYVNPRFSLVSGYTPAEVLGRNPRVFKSGGTSPEVYRAMWQTLSRGGVWTGELINRTKSGEVYLEAVVIAPVADEQGRATHYVALKDDITAKQRHEAELTAKLAREHELSEMKTRFISVTSHEFRTPMAAAMGSVEILSNHLDRLAPEKRRELLDRITSSLHRMTVMLDDILLLNRMDANRVPVQLTPVDLHSFAKNVLEEIRLGDRDAHRFELSATGETAAVVTDPSLLHHILSNLLSNAVRYSPAGTLITLRLAVAAGRTQIAVEDQGIGVPAADRARIFEPFERGSNVGSVKGTGLGLNIVKRMAGLLGGTVALADADGGGSRFTLDFPADSTPTSSS